MIYFSKGLSSRQGYLYNTLGFLRAKRPTMFPQRLDVPTPVLYSYRGCCVLIMLMPANYLPVWMDLLLRPCRALSRSVGCLNLAQYLSRAHPYYPPQRTCFISMVDKLPPPVPGSVPAHPSITLPWFSETPLQQPRWNMIRKEMQ